MKSYFSRLVQLTGLTFRTGDDFRQSGPVLSRIWSEAHDGVEPIHVEERKLIEPQRDQRTAKIPEDVRDDSRRSAPVMEAVSIQHSTEEKFAQKSPEEPQIRTLERKKLEQQNCDMEERKSAVFDRDIQTSPERVWRQRENDAGGQLEREHTFESERGGEENAQQLGESSVSANQELKQRFASRPNAKLHNRNSKQQIWQAAPKEVRQWVAGTPEEGSIDVQNGDPSKVQTIGEEIPTSIGRRRIPDHSYPKPLETYQIEKPEIHDFHLTIGTICMTIEEPQKKIQKIEPLHTKREKEIRRESTVSRLSRYYIRNM